MLPLREGRPAVDAQSRRHGALVFARKRKAPARIALINGHPDPRPERFCAALCAAYAEGANAAGLQMRALTLGAVCDFAAPDTAPRLEATPLERAYEILDWADQFTIVFPLWLDGPPEPLHRFFAGWTRHSVAAGCIEPRARKARLVVTMAMPAFAHRALTRRTGGMIALPGIFRADLNYIGSIDAVSAEQRAASLDDLRKLGARGE